MFKEASTRQEQGMNVSSIRIKYTFLVALMMTTGEMTCILMTSILINGRNCHNKGTSQSRVLGRVESPTKSRYIFSEATQSKQENISTIYSAMISH